jgi:signal peptidase I
MMKFGPTDTLFIKRVIGVEGDVIAPLGRDILVNGQRLVLPEHSEACGKGHAGSSPGGESVSFPATKVPPSSFFVIGDNLSNSYDSRFFGFVDANQVRARPLYIYWSRNSSRIACAIR